MIIIAASAINCLTLPLSLLVSFFIYWLAALVPFNAAIVAADGHGLPLQPTVHAK